MDYIEGQTLEKYVEQAVDGILSIEEALEIGIQLASVLDYLHTRTQPIIFRDLKPQNIMITPERHIYLIDFGIARHFKPGQQQDTIPYLTFGYAAPEQFGQSQTTPRSDIYSLGVLFHRLLSGRQPQTNMTPFHFQSLQSYRPAIPPTLSKLVEQMTMFQPELRPESMSRVKQSLERIEHEYHLQSTETHTPHFTPLVNIPPTILSTPHAPNAYVTTSPATEVQTDQLTKPNKNKVLIITLIVGIALLLLVNVGVLARFSGNAAQPSPQAGQPTSTQISTTANETTAATTDTPTPTSSIATSTSAPAITYPSYAQAEDEISYYYTHKSDFTGKNTIQRFDSITYGPLIGPADQPQFIACAEYQFAPVTSPDQLQTARHTFTFQYSNGSWSVIDMGNWNSC